MKTLFINQRQLKEIATEIGITNYKEFLYTARKNYPVLDINLLNVGKEIVGLKVAIDNGTQIPAYQQFQSFFNVGREMMA